MVCPKCNTEGVKNTVLGKDFYYCRTCKDEIYATDPLNPVSGLEEAFRFVAPTSNGANSTPAYAGNPSNSHYISGIHLWRGDGSGDMVCRDCSMKYLEYQRLGFPSCKPNTTTAP